MEKNKNAGRPTGKVVALHFIQAWRKVRELTQDELADRIGGTMDRSTLSRIETGKVSLTEDRVYEIARGLGIAPGLLWTDPAEAMRTVEATRFREVFDSLGNEQKKALLATIEAFTSQNGQ